MPERCRTSQVLKILGKIPIKHLRNQVLVVLNMLVLAIAVRMCTHAHCSVSTLFDIQSHCNGSNIFGTIEIYSRHRHYENTPIQVY